jgi:citrate lyase synthetase
MSHFCSTHDTFVLKGIVSRDFVVCFLVSFNRSEVPTYNERVHLLLKFRFRVKFFDFFWGGYWVVSSLFDS